MKDNVLNPQILKIDCPDCYLWLTDASEIDEEKFPVFLARLNEDNIGRYNNFLRKERQKQFLVGRILLKQAVSSFLAIPENEIDIIECPENKPRLSLRRKTATLPFFSISHSGKWIGCAIGKNVIGLDIEIHDPVRETITSSEMAFNVQENEWLKFRPEKERDKSFYHLWTQKEALYKLLSETGNEKNIWQTENVFHGQYAWHLKTLDQGNSSLAICGFRKNCGKTRDD